MSTSETRMLHKSYFRCAPCRKSWIKRGIVETQVCQQCKAEIVRYKLGAICFEDRRILRELKTLAESVANVALSADGGALGA